MWCRQYCVNQLRRMAVHKDICFSETLAAGLHLWVNETDLCVILHLVPEY